MKIHKISWYRTFVSSLLCGLAILIGSQEPVKAAYFTTTNLQGTTPGSWTVNADWQTNTAAPGSGTPATQVGPKVPASIGNTYEMISNGRGLSSATNNIAPLIRTPSAASIFPGLSLTVDTNTILFLKGANNQIDYYTNLILKGGVLCKALGSASTAVITGAVQVVSQTYLSSGTGNSRVVTPSTSAEVINIAAALSGSGNLFIMDFLTNAPNIISGGTKNLGYSGTFVIQYGSLLGSNPGSLGTNSSVIVDPNSLLYQVDMPNVTTSVGGPGKAVFLVGYPYNTAGTLIITNGGVMNLNQHCAFSAVTIEGVPLTPGDHPYSELIANFPNSFFAGGSSTLGSLSVQPYNANWVYGPPAILKQPESLSLYTGGMVHFSVLANSATSYQWLSNDVVLPGATSSTLTYGAGSADVAAGANYTVIMANNVGSITSTVATVSIRVPVEPYEASVASLAPYAFYQLNETTDPATTGGGATAFDNANSLNGLYGTGAQNGFNGILGPTPSAGMPGFDSANTALLPTYNNLNSTVTLPSLGLNTNTVTITAWIDPLGTQLANATVVMCRGNSTVAGINYGTVFSSDYPLGYTWNNDPATYNWNSGLLAPQGQWSLVALTVTSTNATISVLSASGIASSTHVYPHPIQSFNEPTLIGGDSSSANRGFSGYIDDVAVFNKALTPDQLYAMFYAASGATNYAPTIESSPASQTVYAGQSASFSVAGGGSRPLTYQWQVDTGAGFNNVVDGGQFSGANGPILTINSSTNSNIGNYQVILSNAWGTATSSAANLTVNSSTGSALAITLSIQQANGANWDAAGNWTDGQGGLPASVSAAGFPGSTYELLNGSRLRTPTTNSAATFPGVQLTMDGNGVWNNNAVATTSPISELRMKAQTLPVSVNWTVNFPKLILNGGQIDNAPDGTYSGYVTLGGEIDINSNAPIYNDGPGGDNAGLFISAWLTGSGSVEFHGDNAGSSSNIAGTTNSFTGAWNIVSGILLGSAPGSLGTNTITIGGTSNVNAALETEYDLNNPNSSLVLYGQMFLHQNDTFKYVFINGVPLSAGVYSAATLNSTYPGTFPASWALQNGSTISNASGKITVLSTPPPIIISQPQPVSIYPGQSSAVFSVTVLGTAPFTYQWFTNGTVALTDTINRVGSTSNVLTIPTPTSDDVANYTVVITNQNGSVTSSVAPLTLLTPGSALNFTLNFGGVSVNQGIGADWNSVNSWNPGGQPASYSKFSNPNSTYEVVVGSRLRTPAGTNYNIFPGAQLTVDGASVFENTGNNNPTNIGELRFKNNSAVSTNYFNNLVLNGGELDLGDNTYEVIQGQMTVVTNSVIYVDFSAPNDRGFQIDSLLTGSGNLLWHQWSNSFSANLQITGAGNTFTGQWIVDQGALVGVRANSLGTNNIIVGTNGLMAALETLYDVNDVSGGLVLGATGQVFLHQNDRFASVTINGTPLTNGTYSFAMLNSTYPANFPATWPLQAGSSVNTGSGQIIVGSSGPVSSPHFGSISVSGHSLSLSATGGTPGGPWTLLQSTNIGLPIVQWEINLAGTFDSSGNLSTNINTATNAQEFYILKVQ